MSEKITVDKEKLKLFIHLVYRNLECDKCPVGCKKCEELQDDECYEVIYKWIKQ